MDNIAAFDYGSDVHNTEVKSLQAYWSQVRDGQTQFLY